MLCSIVTYMSLGFADSLIFCNMGNRKENLKKSLGLTEYPWSSDDEDEIQQQSAQNVLQRTNRETHSNAAEIAGPSSAQPQSDQISPATSRRIQARMDRDLFWSIINNTPRGNVNVQQPTRCSRISDATLSSTSRSTGQPSRSRLEVRIPEQRTTSRRTERHAVSGDVQRLIAFKKLTRSLHNMAENRASSIASNPTNCANETSPTSPRALRPQERGPPSRPAGSDVPPRSPIFTPTVNQNRERYNYRLPWRRSLPTYPTTNDVTIDQVQPIVNTWHYHPDPAQPSTSTNIDAPSTSQMPEPFVNIVDHSDDELQTVPPEVQKSEPRDENNENAEEENTEEQVHNETGSGARLIEEVVEVDAPDEPDNNPLPTAEAEGESAEPAAENNTSAGTANSEEIVATSPQAETSSYHGVKRKRDSTDDSNEPFSVQEFNQSLLRLLECPVCLEWMEPPISQCRRGHLVCSRCRTRLAACPVCRTPFSSVRNRAMEGVAEMLRYPCRHGCGREVRLRRRAPHEASCGARRYHCPAPACARHPPLPRDELAHHFQCKHLPILKIGRKHKFSMKVNSEQHDTWLIMTLDEYFHLRVDVDIRTWGVIVYVAYIGPKRNAKYYTYEVTVEGQHNSRKLVYTRSTHSDLESSSVNVSRQDCFHLTLDQALNFLRFKNRHCEPDKFLDFDVEITKWESVDDSKEDSES